MLQTIVFVSAALSIRFSSLPAPSFVPFASLPPGSNRSSLSDPLHPEMAGRVAAKLAAGLKPIGAVNPLHYQAMLRFFDMDREDATFTGLVWDVSYRIPYHFFSYRSSTDH